MAIISGLEIYVQAVCPRCFQYELDLYHENSGVLQLTSFCPEMIFF